MQYFTNKYNLKCWSREKSLFLYNVNIFLKKNIINNFYICNYFPTHICCLKNYWELLLQLSFSNIHQSAPTLIYVIILFRGEHECEGLYIQFMLATPLISDDSKFNRYKKMIKLKNYLACQKLSFFSFINFFYKKHIFVKGRTNENKTNNLPGPALTATFAKKYLYV